MTSPSLFIADICTVVRYKQNKYPVLFLTSGESTKYDRYHDRRTHSILDGSNFAKTTGILGNTKKRMHNSFYEHHFWPTISSARAKWFAVTFFRHQRDCWWDPTRPVQSETDQGPRAGLVLLDRRPKQPSHCTGMDTDHFFFVWISLVPCQTSLLLALANMASHCGSDRI